MKAQMKKSPLEQAKADLAKAWDKHGKLAEAEGKNFGKVCYGWRTKLGDDIYALYKEIGIRPTQAGYWEDKYTVSIGLKKLHKEKRAHRSAPDSFEDIRARAIEMVNTGYKALLAKGKESPRALQAAHDWAHARLKGNVLEASRGDSLTAEQVNQSSSGGSTPTSPLRS